MQVWCECVSFVYACVSACLCVRVREHACVCVGPVCVRARAFVCVCQCVLCTCVFVRKYGDDVRLSVFVFVLFRIPGVKGTCRTLRREAGGSPGVKDACLESSG